MVEVLDDERDKKGKEKKSRCVVRCVESDPLDVNKECSVEYSNVDVGINS